MTRRALVIGGGVAGMQAALALAGQNVPVDLIEREAGLGGNLRQVRFLPELSGFGNVTALSWRDAQVYLKELITQVEAEPHITIHLQTELVETHGYKGNFTSTLATPLGKPPSNTERRSWPSVHGSIAAQSMAMAATRG